MSCSKCGRDSNRPTLPNLADQQSIQADELTDANHKTNTIDVLARGTSALLHT